MPMQTSAGILLYRFQEQNLQVFLVHPGGPLWKNKDLGAWTIPKGLCEENEDPLTAAIREFEEETGQPVSGEFLPLTPIRQKSGKLVKAWALEGDVDATAIRSNEFAMEWPPRSGKQQNFPEVDKGEWFDIAEAREKILPAQIPLLEDLLQQLR